MEGLIKEIGRDGIANKNEGEPNGYSDYSDYIDYSDSGSWSDNWNDGPTHSDACSDIGWPFMDHQVSGKK